MYRIALRSALGVYCLSALFAVTASAQLTDRNVTTNTANAGIAKTLADEIGFGASDAAHQGTRPAACSPTAATDKAIATSPYDTSLYIIACDPFRSIRRGRQVFQRKFTRAEGQGPAFQDAVGSLNENGVPSGADPHRGSGLSDSCAACHGRPKGSAGASGDTFTRPDSRDSPHLFGLGLKEMLADEITQDLRAIQQTATTQAAATHRSVTLPLNSKGINYGNITVSQTGVVDTSQVQGVNADLRVRQIFADGELFSIREMIIATFKFELGLEASDPLMSKVLGVNGFTKAAVTTPSGLVLDPSKDQFLVAPVAEGVDGDNDGHSNEFPASLVDHMEFYLLNYFTPGTYDPGLPGFPGPAATPPTPTTSLSFQAGVALFNQIGCGACHIQNLTINHDRRAATVSTVYDSVHGGFNNMYATVTPLFTQNPATGLKTPNLKPFVVQNIFTDFKRHDLGPNFHENLFDGQTTTMFLTTALWGVGSTAPYGHDGRSINLNEVILRHGGEAQQARDSYAKLGPLQDIILNMLNSLVLFPPDDTASTLKGETPSATGYPQNGHGSIALSTLFDNPSDGE